MTPLESLALPFTLPFKRTYQMEPFKQVYGNRTGWTFPPLAAENHDRQIPHDTEERDLTVVRQEGASRWVIPNA